LLPIPSSRIPDEFGNPYKYDFLREIYTALRNSALSLTTIGIRALLERVMVDKTGDHGLLIKNLDQFKLRDISLEFNALSSEEL
jgi:hypothetical protein